jgi:hypothetical protein
MVVVDVALQVIAVAVLFLKMVKVIVSAVSLALLLLVDAYNAIVVRLHATGMGAPRTGSSPEPVEL